MPSKRAYKCRARPYTPPPQLKANSIGEISTPARAAVMTAKVLGQLLNIKVPSAIVQEISGVPPRSQSRILASKEVRTLNYREDNRPNPRGRPRCLKRSETAAISNYLEDENVLLDDKGAPWLDIVEAAGAELSETWHFNPLRYRIVDNRRVQAACKRDEDLITAVCHEEKELPHQQAKNRIEFCEDNLEERPHSEDWEDVYFCDEFHFGVGPQTTKTVKRKRGRKHRDNPMYVHRRRSQRRIERQRLERRITSS